MPRHQVPGFGIRPGCDLQLLYKQHRSTTNSAMCSIPWASQIHPVDIGPLVWEELGSHIE